MYFYASDNQTINLDKIAHWLQTAIIDCEIECEVEGDVSEGQALLNDHKWKNIVLSIEEGSPVVEIERFDKGTPGFSEVLNDAIRDLLDAERHFYPISAVTWLCRYLESVETVYRFTPSTCFTQAAGQTIFNEIWSNVRNFHKGVVYCPGEGFTNEDGAQITTEGSGEMTGKIRAAILDASKAWSEFTLDLTDSDQVTDFKQGRLPQSS